MPDMPDMSSRVLLMSSKGLSPCRTFCPAGFNICRLSVAKNVWHGDQNVRQSIEDLPDILSGTHEIIFARTVLSTATKQSVPSQVWTTVVMFWPNPKWPWAPKSEQKQSKSSCLKACHKDHVLSVKIFWSVMNKTFLWGGGGFASFFSIFFSLCALLKGGVWKPVMYKIRGNLAN